MVRVGFLVVCFLYKRNPSLVREKKKKIAVGKKVAQMPTFNLILLGFGLALGCGEFVGFMIIFICFPTQQILINRKHLAVA